MKYTFRDFLTLSIPASVIIFFDQLTKLWVERNLEVGEFWMPLTWLEPYARLIHWKNTGVAFGMFQDSNLFFAALAWFVTAAIAFYFPRISRQDWPLRLALTLQFSGALGNMIDRLRVGYVIDFISVGKFYIFNIADSAITIGVVVLVLGVFIQEMRERKEKKAAAQAEAQSDHPVEEA